MEPIYLPTLHTFAMDNIFTGSQGLFRFRIAPQIVKRNPKEVNLEESSMLAEFWHGPFCYEKSQMEGAKTFPLSQEGREQMLQWLQQQADLTEKEQPTP